MSENYCQSCGMPMSDESLLGTEKDGSKNSEYCKYCYENGAFAQPDATLEGMIEVCVPFMVQEGFKEEDAKAMLASSLPNLKRWRKQ
jgi:hypothetical protein